MVGFRGAGWCGGVGGHAGLSTLLLLLLHRSGRAHEDTHYSKGKASSYGLVHEDTHHSKGKASLYGLEHEDTHHSKGKASSYGLAGAAAAADAAAELHASISAAQLQLQGLSAQVHEMKGQAQEQQRILTVGSTNMAAPGTASLLP